ncbi:bifunctional sulfate adenylyltransferase/adenylylsulfate kinase [Marinicella sp. S1101]|uniref:bifunctional sulfate adenylyltransferase/adenylylsulfate kinase n=1 Tax=Marinicella marina TaxID=2996016 RepID=UPI00226084ED|nr:bifunctional sulfate adenylyltransferase/adenylylsulfate kinase [Marinicella marina]MCX7555173.1 bifunctional sulfate adenylyltransferase/adenylylsulfate kinase [Marinicella marina]MDJ1139999.1 bifunctional sulfate adenylyltransferase/adenylylsulfate kinase [Marinicella marina]
MKIIEAHGGELIDLIPDEKLKAERQQLANDMPSWDLTDRQVCDIELLLNGSFSPLNGFMNQADYQAVLNDMRLADGTLWPMPITLDVDEETMSAAKASGHLTLRDEEGVVLAVLKVEDAWKADKAAESQAVFGSTDIKHPAVNYCMNIAGEYYLGGELLGLQLPTHYDYRQHRHTPHETRTKFKKLGWSRVVAFQTRNPMHRAHQELTFRAAQRVEANLLIHPVVGLTKPGDIDHFTRVRCYEKIMDMYPERTTALSLLPLAMRMGGPREALWHAIIRKNYGCTHIIVGRDHAGPGDDSNGQPFYDPYAAQELLKQHEDELGIKMVEFEMMVYSQDKAQYIPISEVEEKENILNISGTELRRRLQQGLDIPDWFSYPDVVAELRKSHPPRNKQGFTVFFTGLSGSGKSTIANALRVKLMEMINRPVTLLDGDVVRKHLSSELGFSKEHRNINVQRIGFVASEITKNGGVAICAPIAPYEKMRSEVRDMIEPLGGFVEIHVATPLEECEKRDRKGLYALARQGVIKEFTGISDPYEEPQDPEMKIDTLDFSPDQATQRIVLKLEAMGLIA